MTAKAFAAERGITVDAVYKRIKRGQLKAEQEFKGSRVMIIVVERGPRVSPQPPRRKPVEFG